MNQYHYKILVVGDVGVGKTCILKRYVEKTFKSTFKSTIGLDFSLKVVRYGSHSIINLELWDIAGQERFGNMTRLYYRGAIGAFAVYDVTKPDTFENISKWKQDIDTNVQLPLEWGGGTIPVLLLANKRDETSNIKSSDEMDQYVQQNGYIGWFETSAKEDQNIEQAANYLIQYIQRLDVHKESPELSRAAIHLLEKDPNVSRGCC
ncbi:rab GTPase [Backusella circina FSU 941]|nr:rab GTPase [Backusella circina FSU 941]